MKKVSNCGFDGEKGLHISLDLKPDMIGLECDEFSLSELESESQAFFLLRPTINFRLILISPSTGKVELLANFESK